jgi:hypothetical protein
MIRTGHEYRASLQDGRIDASRKVVATPGAPR